MPHDVGRAIYALTGDRWSNVADSGSIIELADFVTKEYGGIDIWVNNAGTNRFDGVLEITDEEWDKLMNINLRGSFMASREAAKRMVAGERKGVIINIVFKNIRESGPLCGFQTWHRRFDQIVCSRTGTAWHPRCRRCSDDCRDAAAC